ncbi:MAG: CHAT domain-containing protein [Blastocatellia bacterium]|nr:CHAT domain-containing protein [Blastocatellia bacterium]
MVHPPLLVCGIYCLSLLASVGIPHNAQKPVVPGIQSPYDFQAPLRREIKGGEKHTYPLPLKANRLLRTVLVQKDCDVVVRLLGPDGTILQEASRSNETEEGVLLTFISQTDGIFTLEIEPKEKNAPSGFYEIQPDPIRTATAEDLAQMEVEHLHSQTSQLLRGGKFEAALPLALQAVEKSEKFLGLNHPLLGVSLGNLAEVYRLKGDFSKAEPLYLRAGPILERTLGPDNPELANVLNNLAVLFQAKGDSLQAERLYRRALSINEKVLGREHPWVGSILNSLAVLYRTKGDYDKAESFYERSLAIQEKTLGLNHQDVAIGLSNWAFLYYFKGDYQKAEPLFQRSLAITEKLYGPEHPDVAVTLNGLATMYRAQGDFAKAEPLARRSLAIREKVLGVHHPEVAQSLSNLALIRSGQGDLKQAEALQQRSLDINLKVLGPDHTTIATGLTNLARFARAQGDYTTAEPLFKRALAIREKALGTGHPAVAESLVNLALLSQAKGEMTQAVDWLARANEVSERDLQRNLISGSERQKLLYLNQTARNTDQTLSLSVLSAPNNLTARQAALTVLLRRKGRALDALSTSLETLRRQQTPETQKLLDSYARLVTRISTLTLRGLGRQKPEDYQATLRELEEQKEKLEAEISQHSREFQAQTVPITLEAIQKELPAGTALVEYAVYRPYDAKTDSFGAPRYVAYVLRSLGSPGGPGSLASPKNQKTKTRNSKPSVDSQDPQAPQDSQDFLLQFADLGPAEVIDQAVARFRQVLRTPQAGFAAEVQPTSQALHRLLFVPIRPLLGKATHLLISPDGELSLIPFAALLNEKKKYLNENYRLTYLTSGRDLLRLAVKFESHQPPLVLADPDFSTGEGPVLVGQQYAPLVRLQETEIEGTTLKRLFPQAELKLQRAATTQAVKAVQRPELLHLATHGFFLEDAPPPPFIQPEERALVRDDAKPNAEKLKVENPLLRAWLFFAGANESRSEADKGTLTALELAQLDLWGTKLVTLSACETGLGEARTGEGVYGLRRALVLAGSEAQLISLWSVSDHATRELMVNYYHRLKAGEGRSDALRNAQLGMLKNAKRRHPYYWAAFIQSGEWANLTGERK